MSLSTPRDLRAGTPIWTRYRRPYVPGSRLVRSQRTDVVIIGAGISGALIAQSLTERGLKPLILDRRRTALAGSTAASTALLQFELDTPLTQLGTAIGPLRAAKVWLASREAVNELRTRVHRLNIAAHFQSRPSLYLAGNVLDARGLQREVRERQRIGLASEFLGRSVLRHHFGIHRAAALLNHGNAEADPVALAACFLRRALRDGARLHRPHDVADIQHSRRGVTLSLKEGIEIFARRVVLCTGYELAKIVPHDGTAVHSTWAIATRPQGDKVWPQRALIWEASDPYLYLRTTWDGRVICGGEDEPFADEAKRNARMVSKTRRLESRLSTMFPQLDARAHAAWTGSFGTSDNGMPIIGAIPGYPHCYVAMGYGGNGITFSMLAAQLLTAALTRRRHPDAQLFGF